MVVRFGIPRSLQLATWLHVAMFMLLIAFGLAAKLGGIYFGSLALVLGALVYEHRSAARLDLGAINDAFFKSNAVVGLVFVAAVLIDRVA
jgi:4-hydroxybenzoate polyprenyltransferase